MIIAIIDLEETSMMDRGVRRTSRAGRRNLGGMDLDDVEDTVRSMQQGTADIRTGFVSLIFVKCRQKIYLIFLNCDLSYNFCIH